jgi:hypothetical protein
MSEKDFDFLKYLNSIEKMMIAWREHSQSILRNSTNLGSAREHFVKEVLSRFLPSSVVIGSGEITDGEKRSGQQDVIIYRADFPVLRGFDDVNLYLIEGVIATIEVKSDISSGKPNGLSSAFGNLATVLSLKNQAVLLSGSKNEFIKLQRICTVKTCVVGYRGWKSQEMLLESFRTAGNNAKWHVPDIVYQPGNCIVKTKIANFRQEEAQKPSTLPPFAICSEHSFALFIQTLFKAIMVANRSLIASAPGVKATMQYPLNNYFSLPEIPCQPIQLLRD